MWSFVFVQDRSFMRSYVCSFALLSFVWSLVCVISFVYVIFCTISFVCMIVRCFNGSFVWSFDFFIVCLCDRSVFYRLFVWPFGFFIVCLYDRSIFLSFVCVIVRFFYRLFVWPFRFFFIVRLCDRSVFYRLFVWPFRFFFIVRLCDRSFFMIRLCDNGRLCDRSFLFKIVRLWDRTFVHSPYYRLWSRSFWR